MWSLCEENVPQQKIRRREKPDDALNILAAKLQDDPILQVSWIEGYSAEDIATLQREDTDIDIVRT